MRIDVYNLIHKAQREHLFTLSIQLGKMDFANSAEVFEIKKALKKMIAHLQKHSENEERFVHPFYENFKPTATLLESQHALCEKELLAIEKLLDEEDFQNSIYTLFNRFLGQYLLHMDQEEQLQRDILWQNYSDEALADIHTQFQQNSTSEENLANMEFMLPCLQVQEVKRIFQDIKKRAPQAMVEQMTKLIKTAFSPLAWQQINEERI